MKEFTVSLIIYICVINIIGFILMGADKKKAVQGKWRIRESTLFLVSIIGGSVGTLAGMFFFHHKTKKWYFRIFMPLILILHIVIAAVLIF